MKIVAGAPSSRAAHATAWPWFPALAATTPAARSASVSVAILLTAPRILNEPVRCRFSAFSHTSRPVMRENVSDGCAAVTRATPSSRARAVSMSATVGAVLTAIDLEDLGEYLLDRRQRIQLALLHLVEDTAQLRIFAHRALEVALRAQRGDREDLAREISPPSRGELALRLEH